MAESSAPTPIKYDPDTMPLDSIQAHARSTFPESMTITYLVDPQAFDEVWQRLRPQVLDKGTPFPRMMIPAGRHDLALCYDPTVATGEFICTRPVG